MSNELATTDLAAQMEYAKAAAVAAILPAAYRGKPADILIATGLGNAIGIAPAQALYEIYVVNGRPSPSANLMAALVRRAGHRLRIDGDATRCTATLIRADDPEAPFTATWTIDQAKAIPGLTTKDTWKSYPGAMLRARAISEVVRMGASEAVLGMDYSREELEDVTVVSTVVKPTGLAAVRAAVAAPESELDDVEDSEEMSDAHQWKVLNTILSNLKVPRDDRHAYVSGIIGHDIGSAKELTFAEAATVIRALEATIAERAE